MKDELRQTLGHPGWRAAIAVALLAVLLTAMSGGFGTAKARRTYPEYGLDATIDNGALALTPLRAWISDARPGTKPSPYLPPARYLVLQLRVENRTDSSLAVNNYLHNDVVWLRRVPGEGEKADVHQRSDGHDFGFELPPRLPVEVDLVWKLAPESTLPARLTWGVLGREYVAETYLTGDSGWVQRGPLAKLVLPVEDRRMGAAR